MHAHWYIVHLRGGVQPVSALSMGKERVTAHGPILLRALIFLVYINVKLKNL